MENFLVPPLITQNFFGPLHFAQPPHQSIYERSLIRLYIEFWRPFWKKRPHRFTQGGDFCRQPDFNLPMDKLSKKKSVRQKSPGGACFGVLACSLYSISLQR